MGKKRCWSGENYQPDQTIPIAQRPHAANGKAGFPEVGSINSSLSPAEKRKSVSRPLKLLSEVGEAGGVHVE